MFFQLPHDYMLIFVPYWEISPNVLIQQCIVECYRHVVETAQSASPTSAQRGCGAQHLSYAAQCRSAREVVHSCPSCFLLGFKSGSHKDRSVHVALVVTQPLDSDTKLETKNFKKTATITKSKGLEFGSRDVRCASCVVVWCVGSGVWVLSKITRVCVVKTLRAYGQNVHVFFQHVDD